MAENLNEYFSSVFTREDISILPVLETKFERREFDYLGQLIVTPTMVAMKISDTTDNTGVNHLEWMGFLPNYYWKL